MSEPMEVTLQTVIDRLMSRPGVQSVSLCVVSSGLVVQSTIKDEEEARRVGQEFSRLARTTREVYESLGISEEKAELISVRSPTREYVLTMADEVYGGPDKSDLVFVVARNPSEARTTQ